MATYVIGDIQGCYQPFLELTKFAGIRPGPDRIWFVGDLVNRGPQSLEMLRWVRDHRDDVVWVTGNHELHLMGMALKLRKPKGRDTVQAVLDAPDGGELIDMIRKAPFVHREGQHFMVHAGLHPDWTLDQAEQIGREAQDVLASDDWGDHMAAIYGAKVSGWKEKRKGPRRIRAALNYFTRARTLRPNGAVSEFSGAPGRAEEGHEPWFNHRPTGDGDTTLIFGHWSTMGFNMRPNLIATDTGCVYGRALTAVRLEDRSVFQVPGLHPAIKT